MHENLTDREDSPLIAATLARFLAELEHCILEEQWEQLLEVLDKRQQYFETLVVRFETMKPAWLNEMILQVRIQDDALLAKVLVQKERVEQERLSLIHSRQAVKAYQ
jgi:hypothetical protein